MGAKDILRVLYSPQKAFKDIIQNPSYLGPLVLLIIFVVAQDGGSYVVASRSYIEQTMPMGDQKDLWTENSAFWQANPGVSISNNTIDFINGTAYYGQTSIQFSIDNGTKLQLALADLGGSINCADDGFNNLSFRIKIAAPIANPTNVTFYLYSLSDSDFFFYDLSYAFSSNTYGKWNNITFQLDSGDWSIHGSPKWSNISSILIESNWDNPSRLNVLIDGLFFRGSFKDPIELYGISYLATSALNAIAPFLFEWLILTVLIYVLIKALKGEVVWKPLMVAVGFALISIVIQALIIAVVYAELPTIYYPLEVLAGVLGEFEIAYQVILDSIAFVTLVGGILQAVIYALTVALCTFIVRSITEFGWIKSLSVSGLALLFTIIILGFVLGI